jgi:Zn-dependent M28 family amino/carboxypeptidase
LKNEYVVLSAHLDHIGVTPPVKGDSINNGALDNASGVATTLEVARLFQARAPKRSIVFLIDTAEEKGLVGAEYFARNPTVPKTSIVADVDLDMPILTYDFTDVTAFGADRSSIGPSVKRAAARLNVKLSPDPSPDEGFFTRSDHYRFVEQGVPAVFLATGYANGGETAYKTFMAQHYHKPSDDLSQPIRYDAGAKFARLNYEITRELADGARPAWNKGDFFAAKFAKHK